MKRLLEFLKMSLVYLVLAGFLLFCGDWGVVLLKHGNAFSTITVHQIVTTQLKSGKQEIFPGEDVDQTCVHSLFPHQGYSPCWYLEKHKSQIVQY
jgi:hypothetical protein